MAIDRNLHSDLAIPPGEYLREVLDDCEMSQADLARRMGRPVQAINEISKGAKAITPETALQLEQVTGVPAHIWTGLEEEYRLTRAKKEERAQLEREAHLVDLKVYSALAKLGRVSKVRDRLEKVRELWRFFGVASLHHVPVIRTYSAAFRVSQAGSISSYAVAAWLRCGELEAMDAEVEPYSERKLRHYLEEFRSWTQEPPEVSIPKLHTSLADCGVAFVLLPHLPKTRAHGATFWMSPDKVVVQMSIRGKWADVFWFSLFHELGHVLLHGKRQVFVEDGVRDDPAVRKLEEEANAFASDQLIPREAYQEFLGRGGLSRERIVRFAQDIGVATGIVVGRLQHQGILRHHQFNDLRDRYEWREQSPA